MSDLWCVLCVFYLLCFEVFFIGHGGATEPFDFKKRGWWEGVPPCLDLLLLSGTLSLPSFVKDGRRVESCKERQGGADAKNRSRCSARFK